MPTLVTTPLNNGIVSVDPTYGYNLVSGMIALPYDPAVGPSYVYWDSVGNVYYQANPATPATIIFTATFPILCASIAPMTVFDVDSNYVGYFFNFFMGGTAGNYVWGSVDTNGASTLASYTSGTVDFTSVCLDQFNWDFVVGTSNGYLKNFHIIQEGGNYGAVITPPTITDITQLISSGLPSGSTLKIASIIYDTLNAKYLINTIASTNAIFESPFFTYPDGTSYPVGWVPYPATNYSAVYYGTLTTMAETQFVGNHYPYGAIGRVEDSAGLRKLKLVIAGENGKFFNSTSGDTWKAATFAEMATPIGSLSFNSWVFIAGSLGGTYYISTNADTWDLGVAATSDVIAATTF